MTHKLFYSTAANIAMLPSKWSWFLNYKITTIQIIHGLCLLKVKLLLQITILLTLMLANLTQDDDDEI